MPLPEPPPGGWIEPVQRVVAEMKSQGWQVEIVRAGQWRCTGPRGEKMTFNSNNELVLWWDRPGQSQGDKEEADPIG